MPAFLEDLNAVAAVWLERMWAVVWQSTILVAAVALVATLLLRRSSPAIRYWVWQILAVKLLLMPFWMYSLPLPQFLPRQSADLPVVSIPDAHGEAVPSGAVRSTVAAESPLMDSAPEPGEAPVPSDLPRISWQVWLLIGWGVVVLAQAVRLIRQRWRLMQLLRQAIPADDALQSVVNESSGRLGLARAPQAMLTEIDCSPFVCGIRRAVIVLPRPLAATLSPAELRHVLLHELAHVRRRDLVWSWIGEIARAVYFFHPVVRWICRRILLERELACDAIAMSLTGRNASEYAATLVRVVSQSSEPTVFKTAAASAGFGGETR